MATERYVNNGQTTVASDYSAGGTTLTVANGSVLPALTGGDQFHIIIYDSVTPTNAEIMLVTARSGNTLTVEPAAEAVRGVQDEFDHATGEVVAAILSVDAIDQIVTQIGNALYSVLGHNHDGVYALASHTHSTSDITGFSAAVVAITDPRYYQQATADALFQPKDAGLTSLAGLAVGGGNNIVIQSSSDVFDSVSIGANRFPARNSSGDIAAHTITDYGLTLVAVADAAAARTALGLGALAVLNTVGTSQIDDTSVTEAKLSLSDNTTNNASSSKHGLLPKLSNVVTEFLNGQGGWTVPTGKLVQRAHATYTGYSGMTAAIPFDDSIPQSGEGTEIVTQAITPTNANNIIRVRFQCFAGASTLASLTAALFVDSGADAVRAVTAIAHSTGYIHHILLEYEVVAGSTSARTYKIRAGPMSGPTMYINGDHLERKFGGTSAATLTVEEVTP